MEGRGGPTTPSLSDPWPGLLARISPPAGHAPRANKPPPTEGGGEEYPGLKNKITPVQASVQPPSNFPCPKQDFAQHLCLIWVSPNRTLTPAPVHTELTGFCTGNAAGGPWTPHLALAISLSPIFFLPLHCKEVGGPARGPVMESGSWGEQ